MTNNECEKCGLERFALVNDELLIRRAAPSEQGKVRELLASRWGSHLLFSRGKETDASAIPAFVAERAGQTVGLISLLIANGQCEVITLDSFDPGKGIGTALLNAGVQFARHEGCRRLWLITSNDNINALRFYQKAGLKMCALYPDAVTRAREKKPSIPLTGEFGIPIRDEIEFELLL